MAASERKPGTKGRAWRQAVVLAGVVLAAVTLLWVLRSGGSRPLQASTHAPSTNSGPGVWPQPRANAQHTGQVQLPGPLVPRLKWRSRAFFHRRNDISDVTPVLAGDGTLFCAWGSAIFSLAPDGAVRWSNTTHGNSYATQSGLAVGPGGRLFLATEAHETDMPRPGELLSPREEGLSAIAATGSVLWKYLGGEPRVGPLIDPQGRAYVVIAGKPPRTPAQVVMLTPKGQVLRQWSVPGDTFTFSDMVLRQQGQSSWAYYMTTDTLVSPSKETGVGVLYLLRPDAPVRKVTLPPMNAVWGLALSEKENALYALATWSDISTQKERGTLYRIDATSLKVQWHFRLQGSARSCLALTTNAIYVGGVDEAPQSYDKPRPTIHDHTLYAISHGGKLLWKRTLDGPLYHAPAVDQRGDIYLTARSERDDSYSLFCLRSNGTERWRFKISDYRWEGLSAPVIGDRQTIYCFGTRVYAIGDASEAGQR